MNAAAVNALLGVILLVLGRKLFWFFVAVAGFLAGLHIAEHALAAPEWMKLLVGLVVGIFGAVLAIFLQKIAVAIAGFLIGGYIVVQLLHSLVSQPVPWEWIAYVAGGVIGAILVVVLFDWALIVLSSFSGALLVVEGLHITKTSMPLVFILLVIAGIVVQAALMHSTSRTRPQ